MAANARAAAAAAGAAAANPQPQVNVAMRDMWVRLGYQQGVATAIESEIGYSSLAHLDELSEQEDAAVHFVKNIRRWNDGANGYKVSLRAEKNTQKLMFFLKHRGRTSRAVAPADVTLDKLKSLDLQYKVEADHDASAATCPTIDAADWSKTLEGVQDFLNLHRGHTGVPLGYVVREDLLVPDGQADPPRGEVGSLYTSDDQEMIARAPILTAAANGSGHSTEELEKTGPFSEAFTVDSRTAYNLLAPMFQGHPSYTYFKEGRKSKCARTAFFAVWDHYLGPHMVDHLSAKWEKELTNTKYLGEGKNGNFEQYATRQKDLHQKLDGLKRHGYQGLDERTKVRHFIAGLIHSSMTSCKLHLQTKAECRASFDSCVQVVRDFIQSDSTGEHSLNISAVTAAGTEGMSDADKELARWFTWDEWDTFDDEKQQRIISIRKRVKEAGGTIKKAPGGGGSSRKRKAQQAKVASLQKSNAQLKKRNKRLVAKQAKIAALQRAQDESSGSSEDSPSDGDDPYPSTRGEVAKKKSKKKKKSKVSVVRTVRISRTRSTIASSLQVNECNAEMDSHADTCVIGKCALVVQDYNEPVTVVGWNPEAEAQSLKTVSAAVKYTHPFSGQRYILVFHQAIHHPELEHHLLCPMQMRMQGVDVNETPKFLVKNPTEDTFALRVTDETTDESLIIPFGLHGVTAYFTVSKPTRFEYEDESIPKIDMTAADLPWDPTSEHFGESEAAMTDFRGQVVKSDTSARGRDRLINAVQSTQRFDEEASNSDYKFLNPEPYTPKSNAAEVTIKELKKGTRRQMQSRKVPKKLWDHAIELQALIMSHTSRDNIYDLEGEVPETLMMGETADISQISEFEFYQWVMFRDEIAPFPEDNVILGRWLGPSIDVGPAMTAKILKANGQVVHRSTFRELTQAEWESEEGKTARQIFDEAIHQKLGQPSTDEDYNDVPDTETPAFDLYEDDDVKQQPNAPDEEEPMFRLLDGQQATVEGEIPTPEEGDEFVNATIMLPRGTGHDRGRVVSRKRDEDGNPVGRRSESGLLAEDSRLYLVEFPDGEVTELTANTIATTMYANCDAEGNEYILLDAIIDWRKKESALSPAEQEVTVNGQKFLRRTTAGVELCCRWKDGTTSYQPLSLLKESHPVQVAEFAVAMGIEKDPAFNWWVKPVLKRRDRIVSAVNKRQARYLKKRYKFGIEVPSSVEEAYALDKKNGDTFWADAIAKELKNIRVAFRILGDEETIPIGYQQIRCFFIFDVKMEDLRRKARLVAGGHTTETPAAVTYSTVVSRDTVRIALTVAALNDLKVKAGDIMNAYISAPCKEKIWTVLGPEWGADRGKKALIVRACYGLKSSGAAFRNHLASCMRHLGYTSSVADPDLWMKKVLKPKYAGTVKDAGDSDGENSRKKRKFKEDDSYKYYYSYILCYVDDILCIHHDPLPVLAKLDKYFQFKPGSVGDPDFYLGSKLKLMEMANGAKCWAASPSKYVQEAVSNVEAYVKELDSRQWVLPKQAANPFRMGYEPEIDTTPELEPELASYYMQQIGVLRWIVEIGRIDIATEVSLLSSHVAMPREGHLEALLHVFAHIKQKHNSRLALDPSTPKIDDALFKKYDWTEQYHGAKEPVPANAPEALGKEVVLRLYVDSDHAGEKLTRRSRTGWLIYMQNALIQFHSKRQSTIETSVFGAEFCAMKSGIEALRGIRYKLRMMGVPLAGPSYIFGDNMSVIHNTQRPESTLKKKSCSVAYHFCREAVAMDECRTCHIPTAKNPADLCTKVLYGEKRRGLVRAILFDIYD